jgi:nucleotide-binding universal stress UspA family protein
MKILLAIDATHFNKEQLGFPLYISGLAKGDLTVLFLENLTQVYVPFSKYGHMARYELSNDQNTAIKKEIIENNINVFVQACDEKNIPAVYLRARGFPVDETIEASRFADLLLIAPSLSFEPGDKDIPTRFAEEVLSSAQSPVMVMPHAMQEIKELFFTYNGGYSSVYAIRQFTLLFPLLRNRKAIVLYVAENDDEVIAHKQYIKEYLLSHYEQVEFKTMTGNPSATILSHLYKQRDCLVTFGAYGRNRFSQFFKKSKAEGILKSLDMPVFITHP